MNKISSRNIVHDVYIFWQNIWINHSDFVILVTESDKIYKFQDNRFFLDKTTAKRNHCLFEVLIKQESETTNHIQIKRYLQNKPIHVSTTVQITVKKPKFSVLFHFPYIYFTKILPSGKGHNFSISAQPKQNPYNFRMNADTEQGGIRDTFSFTYFYYFLYFI